MNEDNRPVHCELILRSSAVHLSQIFTGLGILAQSGLISVKLTRTSDYSPNAPQRLRVIVDGKTNLIFDARDSASIDQEDLDWATLYLKRSYDHTLHTNSKIQPLGLNYAAYGENDFSREISRLNFEYLLRNISNIGTTYKSLLRHSAFLNKLFRQEIGRGVSDFTIFEGKPRVTDKPIILFQFRLWDPNSPECTSKEIAEEREIINTMRVNCLIELKKTFGKQFIGGIAPNQFAKRCFPQLLLTSRQVKKAGYINELQKSSICVTTMGLMGSNGWKLGEYVAGSKAIVCEHPRFEVPGNFNDRKNYLGFSTPDECVHNVGVLAENPELRYSMMIDNFAYYKKYLRPDRLVWNAISKTINS